MKAARSLLEKVSRGYRQFAALTQAGLSFGPKEPEAQAAKLRRRCGRPAGAALGCEDEIDDPQLAIDLSRAMARLRRDDDALGFARRAAALKPTKATMISLAGQHALHGDFGSARSALAGLQDDALSTAERRDMFAVLCRIATGQGDPDLAMSYVDRLDRQDIENQKRIIALLLFFGRVAEAEDLFKAMERSALATDRGAIWYAGCLRRKVEYDRAWEIASAVSPGSSQKPHALLLAMQTEWDRGRFDKIADLAAEASRYRVVTREFGRFCRRVESQIDAVAPLRDAIVRQARQAPAGPSPFKLAEPALACCEVGEFDLAHALAQRSIEEAGVAPDAWLARGLAAAGRGDPFAALGDFQICRELHPLSHEIYRRIADVASLRPGGYALAQDIMREKDRRLPAPRMTGGIGGAKRQNADAMYRLQISGEIKAWASERRANSALLSYLARRFGSEKLAPFDPGAFRAGSALVLPSTSFGVGDEVRMSRYFQRLSQNFGSVSIGCDPRLLPVYRRNFPDLRFIAQQRTMEVLLARNPDFRVAGERAGSFTLNAALIDEIERSDKVLVIEDLLALYHGGDLDERAPLKPRAAGARGGRLRVGLLLASNLSSSERARHFGDLAPFGRLFQSVDADFFLLANLDTPEERDVLARHGVGAFDGVDFHMDFEAALDAVASLDAVFGTSTFAVELAAAAGVPTAILGFSPELVWMRSGPPSYEGAVLPDRFSANSVVITGETRELGFGPTKAAYEDRLCGHVIDWLRLQSETLKTCGRSHDGAADAGKPTAL